MRIEFQNVNLACREINFTADLARISLTAFQLTQDLIFFQNFRFLSLRLDISFVATQ